MNEPSKEALVGEALRGLKTHQGYKVLIDEIIFPMYKDALHRVLEKEDVEARATMNAIKNIVEKVDDSINLGDMVSKEYQQKFQQHSGTE